MTLKQTRISITTSPNLHCNMEPTNMSLCSTSMLSGYFNILFFFPVCTTATKSIIVFPISVSRHCNILLHATSIQIPIKFCNIGTRPMQHQVYAAATWEKNDIMQHETSTSPKSTIATSQINHCNIPNQPLQHPKKKKNPYLSSNLSSSQRRTDPFSAVRASSTSAALSSPAGYDDSLVPKLI
ncbi:unnamed protein product [Urochloa humidicola]